MKLRIECYDDEMPKALGAVKRGFKVKKVSKGYPNSRPTTIAATPCESRYYIDIDGINVDDGVEPMTACMLRFLGALREIYGFNSESEIESVRKFYAVAPSLSDEERFKLFAEWQAAVLGRCAARRGAPNG